ncbi:Zn-dependent hydrolase [Acuticoccus mangrovi]|uniref:Zn-dependent hydrolase n=1 Tax=Acuticoccus mangrovi TaxID=2796142 RepID=A0A934ISJ4_9HYPH|nr:Zn-dependent hydrolase [Acuticoccus mangrovi]MBJ3777996.1 Zn-dependent hydrolase [Acuticoccus mangrovi]
MLTINADRLWRTLMRSAEIGPGVAGGLKRLTLTPEDGEVRDQLKAWAAEDGFAVTVDGAGNMFVRMEGASDGPPVLIGSHLDTQVTGGRFDGILGVLGGLEVLRTLKDLGHVPKRPIEVVNWTNEEGARFSPPMMASAVFCGVETLDWLYDRVDDDGVRLLDALEAIGYRGEAPVGKPVDAYFELHIEQAPELYDEGIDIGVVTAGYAVRGLLIRFTGETAHTGPTPMDRRKNAIIGASYGAVATNEVGHAYAPLGKATASRLVAWPNKPGILSSFAELTVDVRHPETEAADRMRDEILARIAEGAEKAKVKWEVVSTWTYGEERFDPALVDLYRQAAKGLGLSQKDMMSQAGHDAYYMSRVAPTAILFSPCIDGITHNEAEDITPAHATNATNVLLNAVVARADRD